MRRAALRGWWALHGAITWSPFRKRPDMEELNEKVLRQCMAYGNHKMAGRDRTVNELYDEEKAHLLALPDTAFSNVQASGGRADKYATVIVDKNRYSVPSRYAGFKVKVLLYVDRVEIFIGTKKLAVHERVYGNNKWSLDPDHYLDLIQQTTDGLQQRQTDTAMAPELVAVHACLSWSVFAMPREKQKGSRTSLPF